jgi:hypothetical protein
MENYFKGFTVECIEQNKIEKLMNWPKPQPATPQCPPTYFSMCSKTHQSKQSHCSPGSSTLLKGKIGELQ